MFTINGGEMLSREWHFAHKLQKDLFVLVLPGRHSEQHLITDDAKWKNVWLMGVEWSVESLWGHV